MTVNVEPSHCRESWWILEFCSASTEVWSQDVALLQPPHRSQCPAPIDDLVLGPEQSQTVPEEEATVLRKKTSLPQLTKRS